MRRFGVVVLGIVWVGGCLDLQTTSGTDCTAGQFEDPNPGDCTQRVCENGSFVDQADDTEVPDDANPCTLDVCTGGAPKHDATTDGEACAFGGNAGICVAGKCEIPCTSDADCDDVNPCTSDVCGAKMKCVYTPDDAAKPSDDGNPCTDEVCSGGVASQPFSAAGAACPSVGNPSGMGRCDGAGTCFGCQMPEDCGPGYTCAENVCKIANGEACSASNDCLSGNCVDAVCCDNACDGICDACNLMGSVGTCTPLPVGATDGAPACSGTQACDGASNCKLANGESCASGADCASGNCANIMGNKTCQP